MKKSKKLLALLLTALLVVSLLPTMALAGEPEPTGTWQDSVAEQPGGFTIDTSAKTISISSADGLAWFGRQLNVEKANYSGYTITIDGTIDMGAHYWIPINAYTCGNLSGATIQGADGAKIQNLRINKSVTSGNYNYYSGFIGQTGGALTIKDLTFSGAVGVDNSSGIAVVCGQTYGNLTIQNVTVKDSEITGTTKAGAFVGFTGGDSITVTLDGCRVENTTVKGNYSFALMIGLVNINDHATVTNTVAVNSKTEWVANDDTPNRGIEYNGVFYSPENTNLWLTDPVGAWVEGRSNPAPTAKIDNKEYTLMGDWFISPVAQVISNETTTQYAAIKDAVAAAQTGDTVELLRYKDGSENYKFTKDDDGFCYVDAEKKTGRLVWLDIAAAGSTGTETTFYVNGDTTKAGRTIQNVLLDSESRYEGGYGKFLKNGDILILPQGELYMTTGGTIDDVYGDITFVGAGKDSTTICPLISGTNYRFFRLYNRYTKNVEEDVTYHFNFKNLTFDGQYAPTTGALNLFVVTCYNIDISMDTVDVKNFKGAVFSVWANDTLNDTGYSGDHDGFTKTKDSKDNDVYYPTKAMNSGVNITLKNVTTNNNGRLIHFDCSPYQARDLDNNLDCYAYIHLNYDGTCSFNDKTDVAGNHVFKDPNHSDYDTATFSVNGSTAYCQNNCLINGVDVLPPVAQITRDNVTTGYGTLAAAVAAADDDDDIELIADITLTAGVNIPENKKITVNGQNHTITINASASQYVFGNGTVSTEGLKGASELTVNNVNFVSSTKGQNYGVITGSGFKGKVSLNNCSFKNLYTAVYMNPNGAVEAELSITNCEYDNTTWGYSVDTVSSPGSDKVNVKTTFTGNNIDATKTFEIFGVAAIYEGDKQIGQYRTLAEAIAAAANGGNKVITVLPGTIKIGPTETLTLDSAGITLKGVRGEKGEYLSKIIRDQIPSGKNMFIYVNAANITFEDLYIEYATNDDAWNQRNRPILTSAAADNFAMKNCYLKGPDKANMLLNPGGGADNGLIEGNTFEGGSSGIYIRPCSGTVIRNNTFINNGKCITFEPGETTGFQNVQVTGNTFNIDRNGGTVTGGSRGNTGDYASTIGIKIFPEVGNTTNQGWGDGNEITKNTFVNNSDEATYVAYAVIPRSGAKDGYTNELIDRISDSFKTDNILPAGALMGYKEVGTANAATQFSPIVEVAQINETKYFSLASAIKAAGAGDVIELVKDVTIAAPVNVTKAVSIDGKGFTLTLSSGNAIFNAKNNVNNDGISESLTVKNLKMVMNSDSRAQSGYAVIAGRGAEGFAISFDSCSFKNMWCGAMLNGCGTGTVAPDVTIKNSTFENVAHGVSFAVANYAGTVTFTGNKMSGETDIQEVFTTDGYVETPTVKVTDGYYTADPTAYLANGYAVAGSDVQGYAYTVAKVDLPTGGNEKIAVTSEQPKVDCGDGISSDVESAVAAAAAKTEVAGLGQDALNEAAKVDADSAKAKLNEALDTEVSGTVTVFAQTYLDVEPQEYDAGTDKVYTVDITPMVQLIATTATEADDIITDAEGKNAVALGEPTKLEVTTPVVVTIPLPTGFATEGSILFVKHTKDNGETYLYMCTVQKTGEQLYIQFVNNNGFSTFEITTKDTSVASIVKGGSTLYYTSLRAAVEAVANGETIELTANCGETVTVARAVSFTLDRNGKTFSGSITPGANYKNTGSANERTISYSFTYVTPSGGGGGVASYAVSAASATHGKVTVDKASASAGSTVTITVAPEKGFTLETLTVKDAKGNEVTLTAVKTGETYTFKMPAGKVTVSATFMEDNTMLNFFVDVKADDYFYDAVLWAAKNGITLGVDETHFAPMAITTRGQMVTFLWRAAGSPEPTKATCAFTDVKAGEYYYKAVLWAVETGITKGTSDTTFSPDANVSRSQTVTFLARMSGVKDDAAGYSHNFADVSAADYFNNAVAWAATNKITDGTSATTFSPNDDCLRGQIVTFLYRNFVK